MKNKKVVRLTESDLHRIVAESVERVLSEGQGWDMFKNSWKETWSGENDSYMKDRHKNGESPFGTDKDEMRNMTRNFIQTGDINGSNGEYYNPEYPNNNFDQKYRENYKKVDNSLGGKLGRAAGMAGAKMGIRTRDMYNKMRGYYNK